MEIGQDTMSHHRIGQGLDVLDRNIEAAVEQRAGLPAQNKVLRSSQTRAPTDPLLYEIQTSVRVGPRATHEGYRVTRHRFRYRHPPYQFLKLENLVPADGPNQIDLSRRRGRIDHLQLFLFGQVFD